ncbi:MAG: hypothetical protein PSV46_16150 [Reyranella sp.]|nr:hypothetical protein [Reyranella sp.]
MVAKPPSAAEFISNLLNAVHDLTGRRSPPTWTHIDKVQSKLGIANADAVEAAIRLAVAKGWLRSDGDPTSSITLTVAGVKLIEPKPGGRTNG